MNSTLEFNRPELLAEIAQLSDAYEADLVAGNFEKIKSYFWASEFTLRYGATEELYGVEAIVEFQNQRKTNFATRVTKKRNILTVGEHAAVVNIEFERSDGADESIGRQTQVWALVDKNQWKIITAHISLRNPSTSKQHSACLEQQAEQVQLDIPRDYQQNVAQILDVTRSLAEPLMAFKLPDELEIAPVFKP